ncbi:MAG: FkbM family methyltransferase [Mucilaginibacter sp.]
MRRIDRIKLNFIRNWNFPGKERLSHRFKPSPQLKSEVQNGITWLNTEDIAIYTSADSYIEWTILSTGTYEDEIGKLIKISLNHGDTALDIGANIGLQSLRMSRSVSPTGKVYAFEPIEYLQQKFKNNIALNKASNVELLPFALSDEASETDFKIDKSAWNQGTFSLMNNAGSDSQRVLIKVGDDLPEIQALTQLALIKIDVEGFENQVLKGLKKTLAKHKPRLIFEYDYNYWVAAGQDITDCFNFLQALDYAIYQINSLSCKLVAAPNQVEGGNLFCVPLSL